jgi:transcriptional regulator with XRE-family HTH domain
VLSRRGWRKPDLARAAGLSESFVRHVHSGRRKPNPKLLKALADLERNQPPAASLEARLAAVEGRLARLEQLFIEESVALPNVRLGTRIRVKDVRR